jgi:hypothetical protein
LGSSGVGGSCSHCGVCADTAAPRKTRTLKKRRQLEMKDFDIEFSRSVFEALEFVRLGLRSAILYRE